MDRKRHNSSSSSSSSSDDDERGTRAVLSLIKIMREILSLYSTCYMKGRSDGAILGLRKYITSYEKLVLSDAFSFQQDQAPLFLELFKSNKGSFVAVCDDESVTERFLCGNLQIWYGKEVPKFKSKNIRLPLSSCFKKALDMRREKANGLTGDPDKDAEIMQSTEYSTFGEMKYLLVSVITLSLQGSDKDKMVKVLGELRSDTTMDDDDDEIPGHSIQGVMRSVTSALGKGAGLDGGSIMDATEEMGKVLNDDDFNETLKTTMMEINENRPATFTETLVGVATRVAPHIEKMAGPQRVPPGTVRSGKGEADTKTIDKTISDIKSAFGGLRKDAGK